MVKQVSVLISWLLALAAAQRLLWQHPPRPLWQSRAAHIQRSVNITDYSRTNQDCYADLPDALSFIEPLARSVRPEQVVIFTGGDSLRRRQSGFPLLSANSITEFAQHHGYRLVFLDQVDYDKSLTYMGVKFHAMWHRIFAMPSIRQMFPGAKYFIQIDDDILIPHKETHMLNHLINKMEAEPSWQFTYGEEPAPWVLNAGFFIMKNTDFCFNSYKAVIDVGLENNARLANGGSHEQEAMVVYRRRYHLEDRIRVIARRKGRYNFNTFARLASWDKPETVARMGDAIVHFTGLSAPVRLTKMTNWNAQVRAWRQSKAESCQYPFQLTKAGSH